jgi:F-type H+-transporting ATPase subunit delta
LHICTFSHPHIKMENPRLAGRYAKSLLDLSIEQNQLETVYGDIKLLASICKTNPDFVAMLRSPIIQADKKGKIIAVILNGKIGVLTSSFIQLLVNKGRELYLPEIATAFIEQYNALKNIHKVKITTAMPVGDEIKQAIVSKVNSFTGVGSIELETAINEKLIGGFVLETEDKLVDGSILRELNDVRKQFLNNDYIHKLR